MLAPVLTNVGQACPSPPGPAPLALSRNASWLAANALHRSDSTLGAFPRRKKAQLGAPKAITATADKLARIIYSMLRYGQGYVDAGAQYYESQYRERALRAAKQRAAQLGDHLVPLSDAQILNPGLTTGTSATGL